MATRLNVVVHAAVVITKIVDFDWAMKNLVDEMSAKAEAAGKAAFSPDTVRIGVSLSGVTHQVTPTVTDTFPASPAFAVTVTAVATVSPLLPVIHPDGWYE